MSRRVPCLVVPVLAGLALGAAPCQAQTPLLLGRVVDSAGAPIADVEVQVIGTRLTTTTGANGTFSFDRLAARAHALLARRIGYHPLTLTVTVEPRDTTRVTLRLDALVQELPRATIEGEALDIHLANTGFFERRLFGRAPQSQFVTRADIEKERPLRLSDMFRRMAGRAQECREGGTVFVNGAVSADPANIFGAQFARARRATGRYDAIDFVAPEEVAGVEVYVGAQVPAQFNVTRHSRRNTSCVVLIWLK